MAQDESQNHPSNHSSAPPSETPRVQAPARAEEGEAVPSAERPAAQPAKKAETGEAPAKPVPKGSSAKRLLLILLVVVVILGIGLYLFFHRNDVETDDAYTVGRKVAIAPHVNGYVSQLLIDDNQFVHKGDLMVTIDGRDYIASLHQAQASLQQAQADMVAYGLAVEVAQKNYPGQLVIAQGNLARARADLFKAETDYARQHRVMRAATSQQDIDYARAQLDSARGAVTMAQGQLTQAQPVVPNIKSADARLSQAQASLAAAKAAMEKAKLNVEWTAVRAPHDGWISQRTVEQGDFVQTGEEMFSIVEPEVWVVANYKETQITYMHAGQKVKISVDAYPDLRLEGHINSLQMGSGEAFSAFPPENATGNFVKTVQRIPVKILIDKGLDPKRPLALGLSVEPVVDLASGGQ
ncbi:HlyD family secretion protein [Oecophyllibacter saccharovorans]|uniref:HlyD family secretion protein n=1 Tax=Oecophyllibacter saccharovorans TaxID=2558360 RepID=UPI001144651F|nr:HlyD family secretion protein [Oecophyllibacter saccharovorans]QDH14874.1 HlyD family secretion protein [Oecophyllibacter saccharovorans]